MPALALFSPVSSLAQLRARPRDRERLLVHADWLQARGDPRGELIAVQDAAAHTPDDRVFVDARARARTLLRDHPQLLPPAAGDAGSEPRSVWLTWDRGFVRRLEILVDEPSPGRGRDFVDGPPGWAELLAALLDHPALALVEHVLLRLELAPAHFTWNFEHILAVDVATRGLERWLSEAQGRPPLRLDLWTTRTPDYEVHTQLNAALAKIQVRWFSSNITIVPPPAFSPASALDLAMSPSMVEPTGGWRRVDLLWFDAHSHFVARLEGDRDVWRTHVRELAERRSPPDLAFADPLPRRRVTRVLDELDARFRSEHAGLTPAPVPELEAGGPDPAFTAVSPETRLRAQPALLELERAGYHWYSLEWRIPAGRYAGLVGLAADGVLMLGCTTGSA